MKRFVIPAVITVVLAGIAAVTAIIVHGIKTAEKTV